MAKYLDLAGLTAYDRMLKEWFKAGVVDIADDAINALFVTVAEGPANNEIWYTSVDRNVVTPNKTNVFGANIVSNTYENSQGIITFDGDVSYIGMMAFNGCTNLKSITIPNSVKSIGDWTFENCSELISITIPNSVTHFGDMAFYGCSSLTSIIYEGTIEQWNAITKVGAWKYNVPATYVQCSDGQVEL